MGFLKCNYFKGWKKTIWKRTMSTKNSKFFNVLWIVNIKILLKILEKACALKKLVNTCQGHIFVVVYANLTQKDMTS